MHDIIYDIDTSYISVNVTNVMTMILNIYRSDIDSNDIFHIER